MARVEVITGPERRRRWTEDQKRAIVAESLAPGAVVNAVARRAAICPGQIYRWRKELRAATGWFARVLIAPGENMAPPAGGGPACCSGAAIEVEFGGMACLRIPPSTPPGLAAAVVQALVRR
jgi:transposase